MSEEDETLIYDAMLIAVVAAILIALKVCK